MSQRLIPNRPFPPYAFLPGVNPHPEKEGGHMFEVELECHPLTEDNFHEHSDYHYAFDLFNYGYYWESHVWWEELWHLAGRKGELADLLKGLIKLAAAGVKMKLGHEIPAKGHIERGIELFEKVRNHAHTVEFFGVELDRLLEELHSLKETPEKIRELQIELIR